MPKSTNMEHGESKAQARDMNAQAEDLSSSIWRQMADQKRISPHVAAHDEGKQDKSSGGMPDKSPRGKQEVEQQSNDRIRSAKIADREVEAAHRTLEHVAARYITNPNHLALFRQNLAIFEAGCSKDEIII
ncbi:MAG: hypothetical protein HY711_01000 [Candidatus Melainabacteria bacterium]|nr:hypothetical protein [Candidatus Melainabacteria bacterium]